MLFNNGGIYLKKKIMTIIAGSMLTLAVMPVSSAFAATNENNSVPQPNHSSAESLSMLRVDPDQVNPIDITESFNDTLRKNALFFAYYSTDVVTAGEFFASQVKSGGPWDYKLTYGTTKKYKFNGRILTGEDLGNIHYGFVGNMVFSTTILLPTAGAVQIYSGTAHLNWYKSYFDDPNDQAQIKYGIQLKKEWWGK